MKLKQFWLKYLEHWVQNNGFEIFFKIQDCALLQFNLFSVPHIKCMHTIKYL